MIGVGFMDGVAIVTVISLYLSFFRFFRSVHVVVRLINFFVGESFVYFHERFLAGSYCPIKSDPVICFLGDLENVFNRHF